MIAHTAGKVQKFEDSEFDEMKFQNFFLVIQIIFKTY